QWAVVCRALQIGQNQPWFAALNTAYLTAQEQITAGSLLLFDLRADPRVRDATRLAYITGGGGKDSAGLMTEEVTLFISDGLAGNAWLAAEICRALETLSPPLEYLQPRMQEAERRATEVFTRWLYLSGSRL